MIAWLAFAALALLAAAALALPLRRRRRAARRADFDLAVFRRQLAELDADRERGTIDEAEARAARLEIERRILAADSADDDREDGGGRTSAALVALVGVPLLSLALYALVGAPSVPDLPLAARAPEPAVPATLAEAVERLAERLDERPDDLEGWLLLGRSQATIGRFADAAESFARAAALAPPDADIAASLGEALFHAAEGVVTPAAARQFEAALAVDPAHPVARYYLGLASAQAGDLAGAFDAWTALAADAAPDAPWLPEVRQQLRALAEALGVAPPPEAEAEAVAEAENRGRSAEEAAAAIAELPPEERAAAIDGMVRSLESRLADDPGDVDGWRRLGRSKRVLGDVPGARTALRRALDLEPEDVPTLVALADMERAAGWPNALVPDAAQALYRRVLALDAAHVDALWFLGLAASEAGRGEETVALWTRLLALLPADSEEHRLLANRLAALGGG